MNTAELTVVDTKLEQAIAQSGLEPQSAQGLLERYKPLFAQANELVAAAQSIAVTDATQVSEIKRARNLRLQLRAKIEQFAAWIERRAAELEAAQ